VLGAWAGRLATVTREAASGNQKEGDNLFIFMILGDPECLTREDDYPLWLAGLKTFDADSMPAQPTYC
jgi:hypothetical protein